MRLLWAPWRVRYIKTVDKVKGCFLCEYALSPDRDDEHMVLHRTSTYLIVMNAFPYINGHVMVAPLRHVRDIEDLSDEELSELFRGVRLAIMAVKRAFNPDGVNIGVNIGRAAGAGLDSHLHVHVLPRWIGDHNFLSTVADTRVISQSLRDSYEELKLALREMLNDDLS